MNTDNESQLYCRNGIWLIHSCGLQGSSAHSLEVAGEEREKREASRRLISMLLALSMEELRDGRPRARRRW